MWLLDDRGQHCGSRELSLFLGSCLVQPMTIALSKISSRRTKAQERTRLGKGKRGDGET
jgi:hypothetical protein